MVGEVRFLEAEQSQFLYDRGYVQKNGFIDDRSSHPEEGMPIAAFTTDDVHILHAVHRGHPSEQEDSTPQLVMTEEQQQFCAELPFEEQQLFVVMLELHWHHVIPSPVVLRARLSHRFGLSFPAWWDDLPHLSAVLGGITWLRVSETKRPDNAEVYLLDRNGNVIIPVRQRVESSAMLKRVIVNAVIVLGRSATSASVVAEFVCRLGIEGVPSRYGDLMPLVSELIVAEKLGYRTDTDNGAGRRDSWLVPYWLSNEYSKCRGLPEPQPLLSEQGAMLMANISQLLLRGQNVHRQKGITLSRFKKEYEKRFHAALEVRNFKVGGQRCHKLLDLLTCEELRSVCRVQQDGAGYVVVAAAAPSRGYRRR